MDKTELDRETWWLQLDFRNCFSRSLNIAGRNDPVEVTAADRHRLLLEQEEVDIDLPETREDVASV